MSESPFNYDQALKLLRTRGMSKKRIAHSIGVADTARDLARRIARRHPALPLNAEKVRVAALLHDIGRTREGDHELNSVKILREEGLEDLAAIVMHGTFYEIQRLRGIEDPRLIPQSLENKLVAYADARFRLKPVTLKERFDDITARMAGDEEKSESVAMALKRFVSMEREIMGLLQ